MENRRLAFPVLLVAAVTAVVSLGSSAWGVSSTITTSDSPFDAGVKNQGWWSETHVNFDANANYLTGRIDEYQNFVPTTFLSRSFFSFDLSSLSPSIVVTSAKLRLTAFDFLSSAASETVGFFHVATDAATLNNNVGTDATIYNDLGSGTSYGSFAVLSSAGPADVLEFSLNAAALSDIAAVAGAGFFSIGGSLLSMDGTTVPDEFIGLPREAVFGLRGQPGGTQELVIEYETTGADESGAIPEPATAGLALASLTGLAAALMRRRA